MNRALIALGCLLVAAVLAVGPPASAGGSTEIEHYCRKPVRSHGQPYGVLGSGVRCNFMHFWANRWLDRGGKPRGWSCLFLGDTGRCHRRDHGAFFEVYIFD